MQKCQCLLFVLKRSYICYYIICMTVPLILATVTIQFACYVHTFFRDLKKIHVPRNILVHCTGRALLNVFIIIHINFI